MRWPAWIDELKERYLADEANVFVLHGAVRGTTFPVGDEQLDCVEVLQRFLAPTRPIVGVLRAWPQPSRIEFGGIMDRTRFENLVKAHDLFEGSTDALQETDPSEALARIWRALDTTGTDQAYLITDAQRIAPGHRKRVDPIPGAPDLLEWPRHEGLRASNNLVVLLVDDASMLREELLDGSAIVRVAPPADLSVTPAPLPDFADLGDDPEPTLVPSQEEAPETLDPDVLASELREALGHTLPAYDGPARQALLPVMDAVAMVLASHRPGRWGPLTFGLDDEGAPTASGRGAEDLLALWRADITLDAAGSMIVRELPDDLSGTFEIDGTGVNVLAKRLVKALA